MASFTQNYGLHQWVPEDDFLRTDFNEDFLKLDTVLGRVETDLGTGGQNARVAWGTYVGNGTCGKDNPNTLTFDFTPVAVMVTNVNGNDGEFHMIRSNTIGVGASGDGGRSNVITWGEDSVSWYSTHTSYGVTQQYNYSGYTYAYVVYGVDE